MQNLSQISGPVCPQLFDLASFLWTIAFDKAEPTLEQGYFIKSLGSGKIVRYIHHRELLIERLENNQLENLPKDMFMNNTNLRVLSVKSEDYSF